jgi:branched-chain amino acid transport system ATP-binding protein
MEKLSLLSTDALVVGYDDTPLLQEVGITIGQGEIVGLIGPNGGGKSTIVRTLMGTLKALGGSIAVEGVDITDVPAWKRARDFGVNCVHQRDRNFPSLTVRENLHLGLSTQRLSWGRCEKRIADVLAAPLFRRLSKRLDASASVLSGGEDLLLALARSALQHSRIVLLDEPSAGLSSEAKTELGAWIQHTASEAGVLLVEQSLELVFEIASRIYCIRAEFPAPVPARVMEVSETTRAVIRNSYVIGDDAGRVSSLKTLLY